VKIPRRAGFGRRPGGRNRHQKGAARGPPL